MTAARKRRTRKVAPRAEYTLGPRTTCGRGHVHAEWEMRAKLERVDLDGEWHVRGEAVTTAVGEAWRVKQSDAAKWRVVEVPACAECARLAATS